MSLSSLQDKQEQTYCPALCHFWRYDKNMHLQKENPFSWHSLITHTRAFANKAIMQRICKAERENGNLG